ncbi:MAG TPA: hypothetical protein VGP41_01795 [Candidatus Lustribacter sp.]|nr:hypothetical protein [Candidatus Lustribacter sp.]
MTLAVASLLPASAAVGSANVPFVVTASSGPQAGSHIVATVTRPIGKTGITLPAALVPALEPGDVVDVDFPDYRRPPSTVNYHVNVAFITETARQHWLFDRSTSADQLFSNRRPPKTAPAVPSGRIHFVYGAGRDRGIPIFFIIPEDAKTRGVDGVRDYVGAHPTDFVDMSQGTNAAVDRYSFLNDFLSSLGSGSIDPVSAQYRVESVAQSLGVSPATIDACYVAGEPSAQVGNCVQQALNATVYQTNFAAPTQAQFLGGVAGAASPLAYAPYIASLLTVWHLFVQTGHLEYEYLPTTIALADPSTARPDELLLGLKVPTIRPPAAYSDVLFFTVGDPQATEHAPVVINDAPVDGSCMRSDRFDIPLHFDHTSRYVNDAALLVTPDGHTPYRIALDPRSLSAPVVDRSRFAASADGAYSVALSGRFGFDSVAEPATATMRLAFPNAAPWNLIAAPHHPPIAGGTLDLVASSASAACLSYAEMQIGSAPPVPLSATQLDARRVELHASLADVPAGQAQIRFYEDDPRAGRTLETAVALSIQPPPAQVDAPSAVAALGDRFIRLTGSGFERVRGLLVNGTTYTKEPNATATSACFDGPPFGRLGQVIGQRVTAQLLADGDAAGQVFPLTLEAPRPTLISALIDEPSATGYLSTTPLIVTLASGAGALPLEVDVRVRHAGRAPATPCAASLPDPTAVAIADSNVQVRSATTLAVDFRADVLHDRAFGTLEMQLVDAATGIGGNWVPLPGTFVRAPVVTQIACDSGTTAMCRLYGTDLSAIDAVKDASGAYVAPGLACPFTDKGLACVYVPRVPHYTLRLIDSSTIEALPDALVANGSP